MTTITEGDLAQGLRNGEFILHYQPKASLLTNRIVGAEALARWRRPDGALLPPSDFIPLAERAGLIKQLTLQLLPRLVHDLAGAGLGPDLAVSFNVTAQDFEDDDLTNAVFDAIGDERLAAAALELEITETQALLGGERVRGYLQALTSAGVGLAMDDYGIGYSSIDTLSQWPFTTIKLDQGIIGRMLTSPKNATIVRSSIRLGHELGVNVVAEGVEALEQRDFLAEAGCQLVQGFLVSGPLPLEEFQAFRRDTARTRVIPLGLAHMAIIDHVQWRRQMAGYAIRSAALPAGSPGRHDDSHPPLCLGGCALGRWYADAGRCCAGTPVYDAVAAPHEHLHRVGARIVERVRDGAGLADIAPLLHEMRLVSAQLIGLLEEVEDAGLHALYGVGHGKC